MWIGPSGSTSVSTDRSKQEIERLLQRNGATKFASMWDQDGATLSFIMGKRHVRFELPLPSRDDKKYLRDGRNSVRSPAAREKVWEQDCRTAWRALLLIIKAKLEAITAKVATFDDEFLSYIVVGGNRPSARRSESSLRRRRAAGAC